MMPFPANINVKSPISPPMAAKFLAIASGKGGVGKTWLAITLSHAMAKLGARPLLFDGDLGLANVDIQLGLMPKRDLAAVFDGNLALASAKLHFAAGGFDIIAGRSGTGALSILAPQRIADLRSDLAELADAYDRIILDLGAGIDRTVRQLASLAGTALVVTSEEPTALTDAYALIKVLRGADPTADIRVVVNMAQTLRDGRRTYLTLAKACESFLRFRPALAGIVRSDRHVRETIRAQTSLLSRSPSSDAARDVEKIAAALLVEPHEP